MQDFVHGGKKIRLSPAGGTGGAAKGRTDCELRSALPKYDVV
jgi:hypothetical protein